MKPRYAFVTALGLALVCVSFALAPRLQRSWQRYRVAALIEGRDPAPLADYLTALVDSGAIRRGMTTEEFFGVVGSPPFRMDGQLLNDELTRVVASPPGTYDRFVMAAFLKVHPDVPVHLHGLRVDGYAVGSRPAYTVLDCPSRRESLDGLYDWVDGWPVLSDREYRRH